MADPIRLVIADDHALFRRGLIELLREQPDFQIVGEAKSGPEVIQLLAGQEADLVLMDVHMPAGGGIEAIKTLKLRTAARVLMLTISSADENLFGAIRAGADGYLLKSAEPEELCQAIRKVAAGEGYLSQEVTAAVMQAAAQSRNHGDEDLLSGREMDVLDALAEGLTNREIANRLVISRNTVKTHVQNILKKLDAANRTEAVAHAAELGLI